MWNVHCSHLSKFVVSAKKDTTAIIMIYWPHAIWKSVGANNSLISMRSVSGYTQEDKNQEEPKNRKFYPQGSLQGSNYHKPK